MALYHYIYPRRHVEALQKNQGHKRELNDEILRLLQTDQEIKDLIIRKLEQKYEELRTRPPRR